MSNIEIAAERSYSVFFAKDWLLGLQKMSANRRQIAVITSSENSSLIPLFEIPGVKVLRYSIPDGEGGKSITIANTLWEDLYRDGFTRTDLIVGIGGGAVTDLTGFVAATWLRGVDWLAIPTTLAGMVDAAVGGKTGINTDGGKNLVGAFHSPIGVIIDVNWLSSLADRDFAAGLAEVIKCGFIRDHVILNLLAGKTLSEVRANAALFTELIERAVQVKASVVSEDFKESSLREILNYGHTFGHAIERASDYALRHGEAVAIGMVYIVELAHLAGLVSLDFVATHRLLLQAMSLPVVLPSTFDLGIWPELLQSMRGDKKSRGDSIRFVVVDTPGSVVRLSEPDEELMRLAYERLLP